jgi:5-methylcytosine-specific restriction endonuclease McrA
MKEDYYDKLLKSEWTIKKNKILKRDEYKCTCCGSGENLVVHHTFYFGDYRNPWEYPNKSLITLCETCHHDYHLHNEISIRKISKQKRKPKPINYRKKKKRNYKNLHVKAIITKSGTRMIPQRQLVRKGGIYELKTIWLKKEKTA